MLEPNFEEADGLGTSSIHAIPSFEPDFHGDETPKLCDFVNCF